MKNLCLHIITGLQDGGAEAVLFRLCSNDQLNRHHVVSLMDLGKYGRLLQVNGVTVTCLHMKRGKFSIKGVWRLWRLIRDERPNVIQTWMYHADLLGGLIARFAGIRNVIWGVHNSHLLPGKNSAKTRLIAKLCAILSHIVPKSIICCAEKSRKVHAQLGYDNTRMRVVPNGYDLSVFEPDIGAGFRVRSTLKLEENADIIGIVARFDPIKDHENLINALDLLNRKGACPHCLMVGRGIDASNDKLIQMIELKKLSKKIHLLGQRDDVPAVMNAMDLHVLSSISEAFPNVLVEAMACGIPCVSTEVGDAVDIIGSTGCVVKVGSPEALALAIRELLLEKQGNLWKTRKQNARRRVSERYSLSKMLDAYNEVWFSNS